MLKQKYLVLDYETRSRADLKLVGAFEYSIHPSTRVLCVGYAIGTLEELEHPTVKVWSPFLHGNVVPNDLASAIVDTTIINSAHNAYFEQVITRNVLARDGLYTMGPLKRDRMKALEPAKWECTAARAAALALPRSLEGAGAALGLPVVKDKQGHKLMLKISKPRKPTKKDARPWCTDRRELLRVIEYCKTDVVVECQLLRLCDPLSAKEKKIWELDQKINLRGFKVDRPLVGSILKIVREEIAELDAEAVKITKGKISSARKIKEVAAFLAQEGYALENMQAKTVEDLLTAGKITGVAKRLLEIRQAVAKTSTAKYFAFEMRSRYDSIIRDILRYWAASTGRWGGMGIQPQNFPRPVQGFNAKEAIEILKSGDAELVRMLYGDVMHTLAAAIRSMIIPREGKKFYCADYVGIELHVLFWVAKHAEGIKALEQKLDLYKDMASTIYDKPAALIDKESRERFVGKESVLGCGYQMGGDTFYKNCLKKGVDIGKEVAHLAVKKYREKHRPVVKLWSNIEKAAIAAVMNKGKRYTVNRTIWFYQGKFLWCELPSGRKLAYYGAEVKIEPNKWTKELGPKLYHWGVDSYTKKWVFAGTYGGKLTENVVQAIARDLMASAMVKVERAGYEIVLSVHDELLAEGAPARDLKEYEALMSTTPSWAEGCPVRVDGWCGDRYKK